MADRQVIVQLDLDHDLWLSLTDMAQEQACTIDTLINSILAGYLCMLGNQPGSANEDPECLNP